MLTTEPDDGAVQRAAFTSQPVTTPAMRVAAAATLGLVIAALPAFLTGALAVLVRSDLGFGEAQLGLALSGFFAVAALAAVPGGRLVRRFGWRTVMLGGSLCSLGTLLAIAALATTWMRLALLLALGGVGIALIDPAANVALSRGVPPPWQGRAFGVKEAAIPASTLVGGASLPLIGLSVGWRWAFAGSAALVAVLWLLVPRRVREPIPTPPVSHGDGDGPIGPVVLLAVAAACGVGAATSLGAFLVETAVDAGLAASSAGALLAGGSVAGVAGRLLGGWVVDRRGGSALGIVFAMFATGALAFAALATAQPVGLTLGALFGFAGGWGWTGLLYFAVVRARHADPARASSIVLIGLSLGGAAGPLAFGGLAEATSFAVAWSAAAGAAALAAVLTAAGARQLGTQDLPPGRPGHSAASASRLAASLVYRIHPGCHARRAVRAGRSRTLDAQRHPRDTP